MTVQWQEQVSLKPYNTFGIDVKARYFTQAHDDQEVRLALAQAQQGGVPVLVIGGGSNLLLTRDIDALVLHMASRGRRVLGDDGERIVVEAEAGEPWHPFVQWTLAQGYCGLENLSLIPGTVGAAPMQNVGAYGVEIKDVFVGLTALDRETGELRDFGLAECAFGYRDSLFKRNPGRWLILRALCLEPYATGSPGLRPGAPAPGGAGRDRTDRAGDQRGDLQHSSREAPRPGRAG